MPNTTNLDAPSKSKQPVADPTGFELDAKDALAKVQQFMVLPDNPGDIALTVHSMWEHCREAYEPYWSVSNVDRGYYKNGDDPKNRNDVDWTVENEMRPAIDTLRSNIVDSISEPDLLPDNPNNTDIANALSQRVRMGLRDGKFKRQWKAITKDFTVDGRVVVQLYADVQAHRNNNRRMMREPESTSVEEANYLIDQYLYTPADLVDIYGDVAKNLVGSTGRLEANEGDPDTNITASGSGDGQVVGFAAPTGTETASSEPVYRYSDQSYQDTFERALRVFVIKLLIRDRSKDKNGEPIYPHGREIHVAVDVDEEGESRRHESNLGGDVPHLKVLRDTKNRFEVLYEKTGRFPYYEAFLGDTEGLYAESSVRLLKDLQDRLNKTINQLEYNSDIILNPDLIVMPNSGLRQEDFKGKRKLGAIRVIEMQNGSTVNASDAAHFVEIPAIIDKLLAKIAQIKQSFRDISGALDVTRGEKPGGITAGIAIEAIQAPALKRISFAAEDLQELYEDIYEGLAYIAQDFDPDEVDLDIPDTSTSNENEHIKYNAAKSKNAVVQISPTDRRSVAELAQLLTIAAQLDAQSPGLGELALSGDVNYKLLQQYRKQKAEAMKAAQAAQKAQEKRKMINDVVVEKVKQSGNRNQNTDGGSNARQD